MCVCVYVYVCVCVCFWGFRWGWRPYREHLRFLLFLKVTAAVVIRLDFRLMDHIQMSHDLQMEAVRRVLQLLPEQLQLFLLASLLPLLQLSLSRLCQYCGSLLLALMAPTCAMSWPAEG